MDPERITPEHLVALAHHYDADQAISLVCQIASDRVRESWLHSPHGA